MKTIFFDLDGTLTDLSKWPNLTLNITEKNLILLRENYQLGLITASKTFEALGALKILNIKALFKTELIITADVCDQPKISGAPFEYAKTKAREISAMIGDSKGDRIGSERVGIPFIHVSDFDLSLF